MFDTDLKNVTCKQAIAQGGAYGLEVSRLAYVFTAKYTDMIQLFDDPESAVMTPEDEILEDKMIEVDCIVNVREDGFEVDVWYGLSGCQHSYFSDSFACGAEEDLREFCEICFLEVIRHRSDLNLINNEVAGCLLQGGWFCKDCPCKDVF